MSGQGANPLRRAASSLYACRSLLLLLSPLVLASCFVTPAAEINERYRDVLFQRDTQYRLKEGDTVTISFYNNSDLTQDVTILPDGRADPYFMNNPVVAGKTLAEFKEDVREFYSREIRNPEISLEVNPASEVVYLRGKVGSPGTKPYTLKMTMRQLIEGSGGYLDTASADEVILRRPYRNRTRPDVFIVNLYEDGDELFLLPDDQIIVERTIPIVLRDYIREYIWGLLPVDPSRLLLGI